MALLSVEDLKVEFRRRGVAPFTAVDGVSFEVDPGRTVGLVGESGCGKSVTSLAIMRLLPSRGNQVTGSVRFDGTDLLTLSKSQMRDKRGADIAMVFQDPQSSLNPVVSIGLQVTEVLKRHRGMKGAAAQREAKDLLEQVGIPDPTRRLREYPHQLSGGMRQRALIAMALACRPRLLIADEPTTALDVTVQAQVMKLLLRLKDELGFALVLVSHDLALVSDIADRIVVMYGGQVAESGAIDTVIGRPEHHYTRGLLSAVLSLELGDVNLTQVKGVVPSPADFPAGCRFSGRCPMATAVCRTVEPPAVRAADGHLVSCHHPASAADRPDTLKVLV